MPVPAGDPRQTDVEFALEPAASGTRLVTDGGFAQLPDKWLEGSQGNVEGRRSELDELMEYLDAV